MTKGELSGTQKLMLARRRIFGCSIGSNFSTGRSVMKIAPMTNAKRRLGLAEASAVDPRSRYPMLLDPEIKEWKQMLLEAKKLRVLMRGVKVGKKKGGGKVNLMSVFQTKGAGSTGDKKPEAK